MLAVPQAMTNRICLGSEAKKKVSGKILTTKTPSLVPRAIAFQRVQLVNHSRW